VGESELKYAKVNNTNYFNNSDKSLTNFDTDLIQADFHLTLFLRIHARAAGGYNLARFRVHREKGFFRFSIPIYLTEICFIEITYAYTKHYLFE
jgi:hypothetical protein